MDTFGIILIIIGTILLVIFFDRKERKVIIGLGIFLFGLGSGLLLYSFFRLTVQDPNLEKVFFENLERKLVSAAAIGALIISIWQGLELRISNRKSHQPNIVFSRDGLYEVNPKTFMCNRGIGPAIITDFRVYYEDVLIEGSNNIERCSNFMKIIQSLGLKIKTHQTFITDNTVLQVGEEVMIFEFIGEKLDQDIELLRMIHSIFRKVRWEITYTDIYGKPYTAKSVFDSVYEEKPQK